MARKSSIVAAPAPIASRAVNAAGNHGSSGGTVRSRAGAGR